MNMTSAEKARMLLPWYVNGNISYDDEKLVESELAKSSAFRKEFELQRSIAKRVKNDKDVLNISVISTQEQRLQKVMGRIRNSSLSEESSSGSRAFLKKLQENLSRFSPDFSRQWVYPAFAFLILVQLGVLMVLVKPELLGTKTPSNFFYQAGEEAVKPSVGTELIIEFTPQAKKSEILALLANIDAEITYHPEGSSSYRVVLNDVRDDGHLNEILRTLQEQRQLILFADRSF